MKNRKLPPREKAPFAGANVLRALFEAGCRFTTSERPQSGPVIPLPSYEWPQSFAAIRVEPR